MRVLLKVSAVLLFLVLMAGCGAQQPLQKPQPGRAGQVGVKVDPGLAEVVKSAAKTVKGVEDSTAVVVNNKISAAVKVTGFNRFRLKSIREEVHRKVSEAGRGYEVNITSDKKLFKEIQSLEKKIAGRQNIPPEDMWERIEKINRDMQG